MILKFWRALVCGLLVVGLAGSPNTATAQFGQLKKKIKDKVEKKADEEVDKKIDDALEGSDQEEKAAEGSAETAATETKGTKSTGEAAKLKPGEGAWANYDFVPGDRVVYYEDFERSPVGDFPERLEFEEGNMEVIEWEGSRYLRMPTHSDLNIPLPQILQEHADLNLLIEGHTDNVGDDSYNQDLSNRRTATVKTYLQNNRRVELVKL